MFVVIVLDVVLVMKFFVVLGSFVGSVVCRKIVVVWYVVN